MAFCCKDLLVKNAIRPLHRLFIWKRRVRVLGDHLESFLPPGEMTGLDVGCGNGIIARNIIDKKAGIKISGTDVLVRKEAVIDVMGFDGETLPFGDKSFDFTMLIDVLHHAKDPLRLARECVRVSRSFILLKDHICESRWDRARLSFMDWVGNRSYGVSLPYSYFSKKDWEKLFHRIDLKCESGFIRPNIYPKPFSFLFDSHLHFITKLLISNKR